jgi:hypothetical protein
MYFSMSRALWIEGLPSFQGVSNHVHDEVLLPANSMSPFRNNRLILKVIYLKHWVKL